MSEPVNRASAEEIATHLNKALAEFAGGAGLLTGQVLGALGLLTAEWGTHLGLQLAKNGESSLTPPQLPQEVPHE
jgi:hypothetical protein